jgi:hypothetical protein
VFIHSGTAVLIYAVIVLGAIILEGCFDDLDD